METFSYHDVPIKTKILWRTVRGVVVKTHSFFIMADLLEPEEIPKQPSRFTAVVKIMFSIYGQFAERSWKESRWVLPWIWCENSPKTKSWGSRSLFLGPRNPQMNYTTGSTGHSYVWWACSVAKNIQSLLSVKIQGLYIKVSPTRTPDFYKIAECLPCLAVGWFLGQRCHWDAVTISWYILIS